MNGFDEWWDKDGHQLWARMGSDDFKRVCFDAGAASVAGTPTDGPLIRAAFRKGLDKAFAIVRRWHLSGAGDPWSRTEDEIRAVIRSSHAADEVAGASQGTAAPTLAERVEAIRKGIYGGNEDPNRCPCTEEEKGRYAGTPHQHYPEPPHPCARCKCESYRPAVPSAAQGTRAVEGGAAREPFIVVPFKVGGAIKALRGMRGWSLRDVERRSGVSNAFLSQLETGDQDNPSLGILRKLAKVFECSVAELIGEPVNPIQTVERGPDRADDAVHPCSARCWRVGDAVEVKPGEKCPECGSTGATDRAGASARERAHDLLGLAGSEACHWHANVAPGLCDRVVAFIEAADAREAELRFERDSYIAAHNEMQAERDALRAELAGVDRALRLEAAEARAALASRSPDVRDALLERAAKLLYDGRFDGPRAMERVDWLSAYEASK